ncbi:YdbL family protein [Thermodesulfobacteriota bacterium]
MKRKIFTTTISLLLSFMLISGASAFAGAKEIKARMKARLPVIKALKAQGIVGENNRGYLEFRSGDRSRAADVNGENSDRRQVYSQIAKQQGTTADLVGKRRALQIARTARPGEWLQDGNGRWYQK